MRQAILSALCAISVFAGCSGSSSSSKLPPRQAVVAGEWVGTWVSVTGLAGTAGVTLEQSGTTIATRDLAVLGGQCEPVPYAWGEVKGTWVRLSAPLLQGGDILFDAWAAGDVLSGTYTITNGGLCDGDAGVVQMTRTK